VGAGAHCRSLGFLANDKKSQRALWYPTQAKNGLEWGTQHSLPVKKAGHSSLNLASQLLGMTSGG
jgi:hypothetical protein